LSLEGDPILFEKAENYFLRGREHSFCHHTSLAGRLFCVQRVEGVVTLGAADLRGPALCRNWRAAT